MAPIQRRGTLVVWKDDRGFGFIEPDDNSGRAFLHISAVCSPQRRPQEGDIILYQLSTDQDGKLRALNAAIAGLSVPDTPSKPIQQPNRTGSTRAASTTRLPLWLEVTLLSALPLIGSVHFLGTMANPMPLMLYGVMSLITLIAYSEDKSRAEAHRWRISEKNLHLLELTGGWIGGFIAQRQIRHKNRKTTYQVVFWAIVLLHLTFWVIWLANVGDFRDALMESRP
ncbi:MAG TPA: cold shock and DUF1294 domain-containing protein [Trichocoleus sp.]